MSANDPSDPNNPLQGLLGDLLKLISGGPHGGATAWLDAARSLAHGVATDGGEEPNVDPLLRMKVEELGRVAELHVAEVTGGAYGPSGHTPAFTPIGRGAWALRALEAWRPLIDRMVRSQPPPEAALAGLDELELGTSLQDLIGRLSATMGPVLLGLQFGSAVGHLAQRALGQYALPMPWPDSDELLVVPANVAAFASDWSLPLDETQLWVCIRELTAHAVLCRPHVRAQLTGLLEAAADESAAVQQGLSDRLGSEATGPDALQELLSDPEALLADLLSPGQRTTSAQLTALVTAFGGYVDHVTNAIAARTIGSAATLSEAWYRYRVEEAKGEQAAGTLFGLDLSRAQVDRGAAFVRGVVERAGEEGLARLWSATRNIPTPAEVDAPGLWLERIDIPDGGQDSIGPADDTGTGHEPPRRDEPEGPGSTAG